MWGNCRCKDWAEATPTAHDPARMVYSTLLELMSLPSLNWALRELATKCMSQQNVQEKQMLLTMQDFRGSRALLSIMKEADDELQDPSSSANRTRCSECIKYALECLEHLAPDARVPFEAQPDGMLMLSLSNLGRTATIVESAIRIMDKWTQYRWVLILCWQV